MIELDCGDQNCLFATDKSGMRTNGGCRCIPPGHSRLSLKVQEILDEGKRKDAIIASLREEIDSMKSELKEWEDSRNHVIELIHDATAPHVVHAQEAEKKLNEANQLLAET